MSEVELRGWWVTINRPEWFEDPEFREWLDTRATLTWHARGVEPEEGSDTFIKMSESGDTCEERLPEFCARELREIVRGLPRATEFGREAIIQVTNLPED